MSQWNIAYMKNLVEIKRNIKNSFKTKKRGKRNKEKNLRKRE